MSVVHDQDAQDPDGPITFSVPGYSLEFITLTQPVPGPHVLAQTPAGSIVGPVSHLTIMFNTAIDISTFTTASIMSFTLTTGATQIDLSDQILAVTPVAGSGDMQFDISFQSQDAPGTYELTFGPNVLDMAGNPMDQAYTAIFTIQGQ